MCICAYIEDPVAHVKSSVDYGNTKTPTMHHRFGSVTVTAGFPQRRQPEFPMGEIQLLRKKRKKRDFDIRDY